MPKPWNSAEEIKWHQFLVTWRSPVSVGLAEHLGRTGRDISADLQFVGELPDDAQSPCGFEIGPALPGAEEALPWVVSTSVILPPRESSSAHWTLFARQRPESAPPQDVLDASTRIGGISGMRVFLGKFAQGSERPIARFDLRFSVERGVYTCPLLHRQVAAEGPELRISTLATDACEVEQIGWRLRGGVEGIEEISVIYHHEREHYDSRVLARGVLDFADEEWLSHALTVRELVVERTFQRQGR
jgi:hypothetical protein